MTSIGHSALTTFIKEPSKLFRPPSPPWLLLLLLLLLSYYNPLS